MVKLANLKLNNLFYMDGYLYQVAAAPSDGRCACRLLLAYHEGGAWSPQEGHMYNLDGDTLVRQMRLCE